MDFSKNEQTNILRRQFFRTAAKALAITSGSLAGLAALTRGIDFLNDAAWNLTTIKDAYGVKLTDNQYRVMNFLAQNFDTIGVADTNHGDGIMQHLITGQEFGEKMSDYGVKTLCWEKTLDLEPYYTGLAIGKVPREVFIEAQERRGQSYFLSTKENQILNDLTAAAILRRVLSYRPVDTRGSVLQFTPFEKRISKIWNSAGRAFWPRNWTDYFGNRLAEMVAGKKRYLYVGDVPIDDKNTVDVINQHVAKTEKCMVVFGYLHFLHDKGNLTHWLNFSGRRTAVVAVFATSTREKIAKNKFRRFNASADVEFVLSTGAVVFNDKNLEGKYTAFLNDPSSGGAAQRGNHPQRHDLQQRLSQ